MKIRRISLVGLAALFGLLFQALIPLVQTIPNGESLAGRIVICSAYGLKTIDIATGAEVPDGEDAPGDSTECIICLANAIGINALSNACEVEYLQVSGQPVVLALSPLNVFHLWHLTNAHGARAPPTA